MLNQAYKEGIIIKATIKKVATGFLKIRFQSRANNFQVFFILFTSYPHHSYLTCNFLNFLNIIEAFSYFMTADLKITQYTILSYFIKKFQHCFLLMDTCLTIVNFSCLIKNSNSKKCLFDKKRGKIPLLSIIHLLNLHHYLQSLFYTNQMTSQMSVSKFLYQNHLGQHR